MWYYIYIYMEPKENITIRMKMAEMHENFLGRIETAVKKKRSIEACWLCYACFENRVIRLIDKVVSHCPKATCLNNNRAGISSRIDCIKRLCRKQYGGFEHIDSELIGAIKGWCKERNRLVHGLVALDLYEGMDAKFLSLAKSGLQLVQQLYEESTKFREWYYRTDVLENFPTYVVEKCRLKARNEVDSYSP